MEFLSASTPLPEGLNVYPWMAVNSSSVATNKLSLVSSGGTPPSLIGVPMSRVLMWRVVPEGDDMPLELDIPANEAGVLRPFFVSRANAGSWGSSDSARLSVVPEHAGVLCFKIVVPPNTPFGIMKVEIHMTIAQLSVASPVKVGERISFRIRLMESVNEDLSEPVNWGTDNGTTTANDWLRVIVGDQTVAEKPAGTSQFTASILVGQDGNGLPTPITRYYFFNIENSYAQTVPITLSFHSLTLSITDCDQGVNAIP